MSGWEGGSEEDEGGLSYEPRAMPCPIVSFFLFFLKMRCLQFFNDAFGHFAPGTRHEHDEYVPIDTFLDG